MKKKIAVLLALGVMIVGASLPAHAAGIVAVPGSFATNYASPVAAATKGGPLVFVNSDIVDHDVVADVTKAGHTRTWGSASWCTGTQPTGAKCPLFWTPLIGAGQTSVQGLAQAVVGTQYTFICTAHGNMVGTLVVAA